MTIILPGDDGRPPGGLSPVPVPASEPARVPAAIGVRDFGAALVRPIEAVQQAAETGLVDGALHDATQAFDAFTNELTSSDADFDAWPERFAAEAKRVRDAFAARIPDGPLRDRFDAGFDLFAKAKAVETRGLATHKRIALNRAELARTLAGYGDLISQAMNPVAAEFALAQGEAAIRNQVAAKVLSEDEGEALSQGYRADIADRRARQFTADDPDAAARELKKAEGGLFSDLDPDRRHDLASQAERAAAARRIDMVRARSVDERRAGAQAIFRREAFLRDLDKRTADGDATLGDIATATRDGILDPAAADDRMKTLETELAGRGRAAARVAGLMDRPGDLLNPDDAADRRAADVHWKDVVEPLVAGLPAAGRARIEDSVVFNTGIAPRAAVAGLRAGLLSTDPEARVAAARRAQMWRRYQPPIPVDLPDFERRLVDALGPYLDLPIPDARKIELAVQEGAGMQPT